MSDKGLTAVLLVDTKVGLSNLLSVWQAVYGFSFDNIYSTPDRLKAQLPYISGEVHIIIIARSYIRWGVFKLVDLIDYVATCENMHLTLLSVTDLPENALKHSVLRLKDASILHLTGSANAMSMFGRTLAACKGHVGSGTYISNINVSKLLHTDIDTNRNRLQDITTNPDNEYLDHALLGLFT